MTKARYKTEQEILRESRLYGEVRSDKYYICNYCSERSSVKTTSGEHLCLDHYDAAFSPGSPVPDYNPETDGDYTSFLMANNID